MEYTNIEVNNVKRGRGKRNSTNSQMESVDEEQHPLAVEFGGGNCEQSMDEVLEEASTSKEHTLQFEQQLLQLQQ